MTNAKIKLFIILNLLCIDQQIFNTYYVYIYFFLFSQQKNKTRNKRGNLTKEFLFKCEKERIKHVHELKKGMREQGWSQTEHQRFPRPRF
ncbi:MAG: hypothetical protein CMK53_00050 [Proteobacteria bacterium]|nr:hypothetical protein [Pseudomonadota bacterium]